MLSSNSETESAAAPFPAPADLFLPDNPTAKQKIRFPKPIFSAEMLPNPPIMLTLRKCKPRNRPPAGSGKLQAAKPSSRWERQIASCETVLPLGAANCKLRNRPPVGSGKLQAAKPSSRRERQIAGCETVLPLGAANCRLRNRPPAGSSKLQAAKPSSHWERQIAAINRRGRVCLPECTHKYIR